MTYHDATMTLDPPPEHSASGVPISISHGYVLAWIDSVWLGLAVSLVIGSLYAFILLGPAPLNPRNIDWMGLDPADHYIGWELFRQDPHWHWPLTYTNRVGYPLGENVALVDPNSLIVVLLKPFSSLLPEPFQYFGIEAVLVCTLQFFFSIRLFRLLLRQNPVGIVLGSLFFLISPPLAWRLTRHFSLSNHWLLVAALLIFFQAQQESPRASRRFVVSSLVLAAVAIATNPYLALQVVVVLTAAAGSLLWQRKLTLFKALGFMAALSFTCTSVAYLLGLLIAGRLGYGAWGYRLHSLDLLAPFDPLFFGSILSRLLRHFPRGPVYPGCNYLGAGVIFLAIFLLVLFASRWRKLLSLDKRKVVPLLLCCLTLTLIALSTKVTIGGATLVDLDPHQKLTRFLAPLRGSDRLFWTPYYAILMAALAAPFLVFRKSQANVLLALVLLIQLVDTTKLRAWVRLNVNQGRLQLLHSPIWSDLGSVHENLVVLPAWQCGYTFSPAGLDGFRTFGLLAVDQKMRINSYYSARYTKVNFYYHCRQAIADLAQRPLSPDTAYVVTPALAATIAAGPTGPGKCHEVDGFILCSSKIDFGPSDKTKGSE
jgi:Family of unknown function (DUF6311)